MFAVWLNFATVAVGGLLGTLLRNGIKESYRKTIHAAISLCVMLVGITGAIKTSNVLIVIVSMVVGAALGEMLHIEDGLDHIGVWAQKHVAKNDNGFANGFVNASLLVCVGAMAVVGSLEAGLTGESSTLIAKSVIDFVSTIIFASTMGIGVAFASIPLLIYQGGIALLANVLKPFLTDALIQEMAAVGSLLIIALSLNMLEITKERIRVGNLLPAILIPCIYMPVADWLSRLF